jgi:hypothetical protein
VRNEEKGGAVYPLEEALLAGLRVVEAVRTNQPADRT